MENPTNFALAHMWPVYVGNFRCKNFHQLPSEVHDYFASKGLLARQVFVREKDEYFEVQHHNGLYDFLVYFCTKQAADFAVQNAHRERYYGHKLNVFPGRYPSYFDPARTVKLHLFRQCNSATEEHLEHYIFAESLGKIDCIIKHGPRKVFVQYQSVEDRNKALQKVIIFEPAPVYQRQRQQRLLERDVMQEIIERYTADPEFLQMGPSIEMIDALQQGYIPPVNMNWQPPVPMHFKEFKLKGGRGSGAAARVKSRIGANTEMLFGIANKHRTKKAKRRTQKKNEQRRTQKKKAKLDSNAASK